MDLGVVNQPPIELHFSRLRQYSPGQYTSPIHLELILDSLQKCKPLHQTTKKGVYLIFKRNIAHLTNRRALRTLIIASAERLKCLFVQAKFSQTLCIWTIHLSNENNSAIVIPTIRGGCTTHCSCSQKSYTCK